VGFNYSYLIYKGEEIIMPQIIETKSDYYSAVSYTIIRNVELELKRVFAKKFNDRYSNNWREKIQEINMFIVKDVKGRTKKEIDEFNSIADFLTKVSFGQLNHLIDDFHFVFKHDSKLEKEEINTLLKKLVEQRNDHIAHPQEDYHLENLMYVLADASRICDLCPRNLNDLKTKISKSITNPKNKDNIPFSIEEIHKDNTGYIIEPNISIPTLEYERETGFIGRKGIKEDLYNAILNPEKGLIYTVLGVGGVGKTSLVVEVVKQLIENNKYKFQQYIFCSAKSEYLTKDRVYDIEPDIQNLEQLIDLLIDTSLKEYDSSVKKDVLNMSYSEKRKYLMQLLKEKKSLIIIDNLETFKDSRLKSFLDEAPRHTLFIITSRIPLYHRDIKFDLKPFTKEEAIKYFKAVSNYHKRNDLNKLPTDKIEDLVKAVLYHPLAIKWSLGQVISKGRNLESAFTGFKHGEETIVEFCFNHLYDLLDREEKKVLATLTYYGDKCKYDTISQLSGVYGESLERIIGTLITQSLISFDVELMTNNRSRTYYKVQRIALPYILSKFDNSDFEKEKNRIQTKIKNFRDVETNPELKIQKLIKSYERNEIQYNKLTEEVTNLINEYHGSPLIFNIIIPFERRKFNNERVFKLCKTAIKDYNLKTPQYYLYLGESIIRQRNNKKYKKAIKYLKKYVKKHPKDLNGIKLLGQVLTYNSQPEQAIKLYRKSKLHLKDKNDKKTLLSFELLAKNKYLEILYNNHNRYNEAIKYGKGILEEINVLEEEYPDFFDLRNIYYQVLNRIAECYKRQSKYNDAKKTYEVIINEIESILSQKVSQKELHILPYECMTAYTNTMDILRKQRKTDKLRIMYEYASSFFLKHHFRFDGRGKQKVKKNIQFIKLDNFFNYLNGYNKNSRKVRVGYINYINLRSKSPFGDIVDELTKFPIWFHHTRYKGYSEIGKSETIRVLKDAMKRKSKVRYKMFENPHKRNVFEVEWFELID